MNTDAAFRQLRNAWFNRVIRCDAHERQWEEEDDEAQRTARNHAAKVVFDKQTDFIIAGGDAPISPTRLCEIKEPA